MPTLNFNVTQSDALLGTNVSAGSQLTFNITNPLQGVSYFVLETVPTVNGYYTPDTPKHFLNSVITSSNIVETVSDNYRVGAAVKSGTGTLTITPSVAIAGTAVKVRGITGNFSGSLADFFSLYVSRVETSGGYVEPASQPAVQNASDLLKQASFLLIPSAYEEDTVFAQIPDNGNGDLTWSRNSTANRTNSSGVIESVGANVPRLSYMYGSCPAALLEPQRTNLVLRSEDFNANYYSKTLGTLTPNSTIAPDDSLTADLFTKTSGVNTVSQISTAGSPYLQTGIHTLSVYIKQNVGNLVLLRLDNADNTANFQWNFSTKTFSNIGANAISSSFQELSNGWFRLIVTGNVLSTTWTISVVNLYPNPTGDSVYIWGAQLEAGAYATTYIPTTTASATRLADTFTRNNIYTNGLISASGGTWYVELKNNIIYTRDNSAQGINLDESGFFNGFTYRAGIGARMQISKLISGVNTVLYTTLTNTSKCVIKWNGTTADIFVNGIKVVSGTAFTATQLQLFSIGIQVPTFIQQMALFNSPLNDIDCEILTGTTGYNSYSTMASTLGYTLIN